jgi:hypothetical protein
MTVPLVFKLSLARVHLSMQISAIPVSCRMAPSLFRSYPIQMLLLPLLLLQVAFSWPQIE